MGSVARGARRAPARRRLAVAWALALGLAVVVGAAVHPYSAGAATPAPVRAAHATQAALASTLLSQGKPATASSTENAGSAASNAFDGSTTTRWSSAFSDPQWIQVDLGASASITQVVLNWEAAYAR